jgi:hypothetical protein
MPVLRKTFPCGCCVGIAIGGNKFLGIGLVERCGNCTEFAMECYLREVHYEIDGYGTVTKYLALNPR